ncbi:Aldehyde/histidinol dehydrogenase [Xylariales sp. PMI_506]|nr:Aldehyde/histidinol dehydrogenase [Xylariales sp. PMI_506]
MAVDKAPSKLDMEKFANIINGQVSTTEAVRHGINPANKERLYASPVSTKDDVEAAVQAARRAFKSWRKTTVEHRKKQLGAFAAELMAHQAELSRLLTLEQGKPTLFAEQEIQFGAFWLTGTCALDLPTVIVQDTADKCIETRYTPLGVVVGIVPWNFPVMLLCGKLAPAILTGNCIIIKPSPFTPYCGIKVVQLAQRFFPPGVVQVLSGDDNLGPWLTEHPGIDKISFTGSTATGKRVMQSASKNLTRVTLELGGNDAAIICSDVDVREVVPQIANAAFMNSGQICIALKRIYVHQDIYGEFRDTFVKYVSSLKVGNGVDEGTFIGPVQNQRQYERVKEFLDDIQKNNQTLLLGGDVGESISNGFFIKPTIVDSPPDESMVVAEEPFGPVVPLMTWSNVEEVIERVNNSDMGLGASVWSKSTKLARQIGEELDVGSVWINQHLGIQPIAAFGGHKKSGIGCEWGVDGLKGFCNTQTIFVDHITE